MSWVTWGYLRETRTHTHTNPYPWSQVQVFGRYGYGFSVVFGSPVPGLEKDWDWTGLEPARTAKDHNHSPVCGPLPFREFQDQSKTSLLIGKFINILSILRALI